VIPVVKSPSHHCGLVVAPAFGEHRTALDCVDALRDALAMQGWTGPCNAGRPKGKVASAE
jgi:hypothetical protein